MNTPNGPTFSFTLMNDRLYKLYEKRTKLYDALLKGCNIKKAYFNKVVISFNIRREYTLGLSEELSKSILNTKEDSYKLLLRAYRSKTKCYRETILTARMESDHIGTMIKKISRLKELNQQQIEDYNIEREMQIATLSRETAAENSWTEEAAEAMKSRHENIAKYDVEYVKLMQQFYNEVCVPLNQKELTSHTNYMDKLDKEYIIYMEEYEKIQNEIDLECRPTLDNDISTTEDEGVTATIGVPSVDQLIGENPMYYGCRELP